GMPLTVSSTVPTLRWRMARSALRTSNVGHSGFSAAELYRMTGTVPCFFRLMAPGTMWMHTLIIWIGVRNVPNPTGELRFGRLTVLSKAPEVALSTDSVLLNRLMTYTLVL